MPSKAQTAARKKFKAKVEEAKKIQKKHPAKKWTSCIKEAYKK